MTKTRSSPKWTLISSPHYELFSKKVNIVYLIALWVSTPDGTITAANASTLNDGAAAVVVASQEAVSAQNLKPLARILAYGDAATHPLDFAVAPTMMFPKILERAGVKQSDVAQWEVNEAFSCVPLAFIKKLGIDASLVNPHGGAVSIGHPIGCVVLSYQLALLSVLSISLSVLSSINFLSECPVPALSLISFILSRAVRSELPPSATVEEVPAEWSSRSCKWFLTD